MRPATLEIPPPAKLASFGRFFNSDGRSRLRLTAFLRTGATMSLIRIMAAGVGAAGSIWVARRLGPEKLGISALVASAVTQVALIIEMQQQTILVREYKSTDDETKREDLLQTVQSFRLIAGLIAVLILAVVWFVVRPSEKFGLAVLAVGPLLLARMGTPSWLFQARDKMVEASVFSAVQQLVTVGTYFLFIHSASPAGVDLWCQAAAATLMALLTWRFVRSKSLVQESPWQWKMARQMAGLAWRGRWLFLAGASIYTYGMLEGPLMGYLLSVSELGQYRSAQSLAALADLVTLTIPTILFPLFIEWRKQGVKFLWNRQLRIAGILLVVFVPAAAGSYLVVPWFHRLVYGPAFAAASIPSSILIISKLIVMLNGVFAWGMAADQSQDKRSALLMVSVAIVSVSLNLIFLPRFGMLCASIVNVVSESLILLGAFLMCRANAQRLFEVQTT